MNRVRLAVTGGRLYGAHDLAKFRAMTPAEKARDTMRVGYQRGRVRAMLDQFAQTHGCMTDPDEYGNTMPLGVFLITGDASGADSLATDWRIVNWCPGMEFEADWRAKGKQAGILRNLEMLNVGKPEYLMAFPGGTGTAHMVSICRKAGVPIIKIVDEVGAY